MSKFAEIESQARDLLSRLETSLKELDGLAESIAPIINITLYKARKETLRQIDDVSLIIFNTRKHR